MKTGKELTEAMRVAPTLADWLRAFADYQEYMSVNTEIPRRLREAADAMTVALPEGKE